MSVNFDRRSFLKGSAATAGGLMLPSFTIQAAEIVGGKSIPHYSSWKDVYKSQEGHCQPTTVVPFPIPKF